MAYELIISAFFIGVLATFFTILSLHILMFKKERTRFQMVLGCIMAVWAVWNLKDLIITFPGMYTERVLNWILLIDGWSALTYTIFVFEATIPGWTTLRRICCLMLPFLFFTLWYAIQPTPLVIKAYVAFLWFYAWIIVIIGYVKIKKYLRYIRNNYSNIDNIDVSWLTPVFFFAIASQLAWLFTSLYATALTDIVYYLTTLVMWILVLHYSWNFQPITLPVEETFTPPTAKLAFAMPKDDFMAKIIDQEMYLNKNLTLNSLADAMHTNRTYLSQYLGTVCQQTFYDFINQLRIEKKSIPLMHEHPEYTLEYIAAKSGFSSISTFRRAFHKFTGKTPSQFTPLQ